ncbi:hypothetical protein RAMLITH_09415 [Ramlibacter sp. RBP-2]|uniref:Lipoprotein n=1 Tax=Ramlibacter lithotrophicus TaxID=2606681 RepID=A0A7X6DF92_9BURK|nr:hypothetical protein [Ramlibacter lithotrophicus]NKE66037.1 hypothetical protein [Ramlibacter lithotrophicus]
MHKFLIVALALLAAGCASSPTPNYDLRFGDAVREARRAMTLNPGAGGGPALHGLEGTTAAEAMGRYHDSFKAPPPVVNVINIGGAVGAGK